MTPRRTAAYRLQDRQPLPWREALAASDVVVDTANCWESRHGLELFEITDELVVGRIPVDDGTKQPMGIVHGGVLASLAETLASWGTAAAVRKQGAVAVGLSNSTTFFRPVTHGHVTGRAVRRSAGRTTWVWDVELSDDEGRACAATRMSVAVRQASEWRPPPSGRSAGPARP